MNEIQNNDVKPIGLILSLVLLLAAYHTIGVVFGLKAKNYFAAGTLVLWAVAAMVTLIMRRRLNKNFEKMDVKTREQLLTDHPDMIETMSSTPAANWKWKLLDTVLALFFLVIPYLMVSVAMKQPLSWNSNFTGYHFLAVVGGFGIYYLGRAIAIKWWKQKP